MRSTYCERGHVMLGGTCSHCARHNRAAAVATRAKPMVSTGPNGTLVELRALKSMLEQALITEAEYDERRNNVLASF
jgi:hypothetical protein